ncbi:tyrosine-type recombinase/integrase [Methanococcus maripaludis]|uniref:Probable integrase/recombinase n=1 Tax=Methanococcus maripaludis (strain DSM 14266 / JCM 13030 / NBRC 101832 / S2 / LL) TaxID=267377 RepID=Q6LZ86_METMP|nr:tyrosine-type recombinase/integrase [Methanococcus maripaludis]CAF30299.1 Probable integrase/recombinase [Methanococcus maripaludis S2]
MNELEKKLLYGTKSDPAVTTEEQNIYIKKFQEEREFDNIKPSTIKNDVTSLKVFLAFCEEIGKEPYSLTTHDFVIFFNMLNNRRNCTVRTQNRYFNLLKVFYRLLKYVNFKEFERESIERKRFSKFEKKHYDTINFDTYNRIIKEIILSNSRTRLRDALIVRVLWETGCRRSEALSIRYKDCDFEKGRFRIRDTKTYEERTVVIAEETVEIVRDYIKENIKRDSNDYIFQNEMIQNGKRVKLDWITNVFKKAVRKLKEEGVIPEGKRIVIHSLRHGRATDLLDKGVPIDVVKEILGHRSLETTLYYSHSKERKNGMLDNIQKLL